ncbi:DinB/UmuC family translesion DNA polymerase [Escherichia coli]
MAQTKTLAKLANHAAKKWQRQTGGVVDLSNLERQRKLMSALPVDDVWGLDGGFSKKLDAMGFKPFSIWRIQISGLSVNILMSCSKERCVNCAANPVCNWKFAPTKQEIICSRSFGERITDYPSMRQAICSYAARAAEKLAASINIVGLSPHLLRRHHLRSMNLITAIARR